MRNLNWSDWVSFRRVLQDIFIRLKELKRGDIIIV
jgi:hypothetical protein